MSDISLDELLKLIEEDNSPSPSVNKLDRDVTEFVKYFDITNGDFKIPNYVLYYNYIKWAKERSKKKWSKIALFRKLSKEGFKSYRQNRQRFYMLNSCFDLSKTAIEIAKSFDKNYNVEKK